MPRQLAGTFAIGLLFALVISCPCLIDARSIVSAAPEHPPTSNGNRYVTQIDNPTYH